MASFQMRVLPRKVDSKGRRMAAVDTDIGDVRGGLGEAAAVEEVAMLNCFLLTNQRSVSHTESNYCKGFHLVNLR